MKYMTNKFILFSISLMIFSTFSFSFEKQAEAINSARAKMNQKNFTEALADADAALNLAKNPAEKAVAIMLRAQILNNSGKPEEAISEYKKVIEDKDSGTPQKMSAYKSIAGITIKNKDWAKKRDVCAEARGSFDAALQLPDLSDNDRFGLLIDRAKTYETADDWKGFITETEKILATPTLSDDQRAQLLGSIACGKIEAAHTAKISEEIKALQKLAISGTVLNALGSVSEKMARHDLAGAEKILRDTMEKKDLNDDQKLDILQRILSLYLRNSKYETCKPVMDELLKASEGKKARIDQVLAQFAVKAVSESDFKSAEAAYRKIIELSPANMSAYLGAADMAMIRGDTASAQSDLQKVLDNQKYPAAQRYVARIIQLAAMSKDPAAFRQDIAKADQEFAAEKFSAEQRFKLLREASLHLFTDYCYDDVRILEAETAAMMRPEQKKTFTCRYVKNPPASADSWARSSLLENSQYKESRFGTYPKGDELKSELAELKDAKEEEKAPKKEGYDTSVYIVYDENGVHIYVKCDDPDARKIEQGIAKGGSLEMYFQPGQEYAYHQWFFELPGTDEPHQVNWDTPHKHYRYTYDYLSKNACVTQTGLGAYTFIPWLMVYDKLPSENNKWIFSMQRWSKGVSCTLGGAVHELGKALQLNFEMSKEQLLAIKRELVVRAYAKYQGDVARADGVSIWKDPVLGDPEFYKSEIAPLLETLNKAGEKVNDKISDADTELLFEQFVPEWLELRYKAAELRSKYLKAQVLSDTKK
ncbi:MAG: hypothetical protein A2X49_10630 [Lentisphaerae bacterium GWF2_52_8]|nr:MAG: hypothetical protein A2X49_10630 [Lentisphaerae bacterium GWF2_52_8]